MVASISHIALIVRDPARTAQLFAGVLGARIVPHRSDDGGHPQSFANFGGMWFVLRQGDGPSVRNGEHISLNVTHDQLTVCAEKLTTFEVEHYMARQDTALYFTDYDNHVFELNTGMTLDETLVGRTHASYTLRA